MCVHRIMPPCISAKKKDHTNVWSSYGAGDEARTRYLHLGKVALYRMSYTRIGNMDYYSAIFKNVKHFFAVQKKICFTRCRYFPHRSWPHRAQAPAPPQPPIRRENHTVPPFL